MANQASRAKAVTFSIVIAVLSAVALSLSSPAFHAGSPIPQRYTCDGRDVSPPLRWSRVPSRARSLAVELEDPDAPGGVFIHWLLWNVSPRARALGVQVSRRTQGRNSFGRIGYSGPCPPQGSTHHYVFTLFAVDRKLTLARGASSPRFHATLSGHIVSRATLVGIYGR
jgi:Raf kinase inhibitor-like YbhB/YbcL family protein